MVLSFIVISVFSKQYKQFLVNLPFDLLVNGEVVTSRRYLLEHFLEQKCTYLNLAEPFTFYAPYHMSGLKLCIGLFHDCRDSDCHNNLSLYSSMYFFNLFIVLIIILSRFNAVPAISEVLCNTFFFLYSKSF